MGLRDEGHRQVLQARVEVEGVSSLFEGWFAGVGGEVFEARNMSPVRRAHSTWSQGHGCMDIFSRRSCPQQRPKVLPQTSAACFMVLFPLHPIP